MFIIKDSRLPATTTISSNNTMLATVGQSLSKTRSAQTTCKRFNICPSRVWQNRIKTKCLHSTRYDRYTDSGPNGQTKVISWNHSSRSARSIMMELYLQKSSQYAKFLFSNKWTSNTTCSEPYKITTPFNPINFAISQQERFVLNLSLFQNIHYYHRIPFFRSTRSYTHYSPYSPFQSKLDT